MPVRAKPDGNSVDRFAGNDDVSVLGQRGPDDGPEEVGQDRRALAIVGHVHDRPGIRLERGGEYPRTFLHVVGCCRSNLMRRRHSRTLSLRLSGPTPDMLTVSSNR